MKRKIIVMVVITIMCLMAFTFGGGFGVVKTGSAGDNATSNNFVVFTTLSQFEQYVSSHEGDAFNVPAGERGNYDAKFFQTQALVMFVTDGMSSSIKVSCEGYKLQGTELHVTVKELSPPIHTMDLRYNTLYVAVPQQVASAVTKVVIDSYRVNI